MSLVGKNAVVTGGASGIGLATSRRFAREGACVAIWDVDDVGAKGAAEELVAKGFRAIACRVDVSTRASVNAGVERVHAELGPGCHRCRGSRR
jgi:2-hydroxycyclohexanecarboxyl-CoA dehydrogenase